MSEPVVAFKRIDPDSPVEADKAYLKVEMAAEMGSQKLHFSTMIDRDAPASELDRHLFRMSDAADRLGMKYSVRRIKVELEQYEKDLLKAREDRDTFISDQARQWTASGRRGDYKLHGTAQNTDTNFRNSIHKLEEQIKTCRHSISVGETLLSARNDG